MRDILRDSIEFVLTVIGATAVILGVIALVIGSVNRLKSGTPVDNMSFNESIQHFRQKIGPKTVRITGLSSGGTGFFVEGESGNTYIMTNKHICELRDNEGFLNVEIVGKKRKYKKRVLEISTEHDLCLVEGMPNMAGLKIAKKLNVGEGLAILGHPKLFALTVSLGQYIEEANIDVAVSNKKPRQIVKPINPKKRVVPALFGYRVKRFKSARIVAYSRGGNSGSPIVNMNGEVISVLFAGSRADVMETYGVPLRYVQDFISGY